MKGDYEGQRIPAEKLRRLCTRVLEKTGFKPEDAAIVSDDLVETDLRGVYSHGVMRFPIMVERIEKKANEIHPEIKVAKDHKATAVIDGGNGMGQVVTRHAMQVAIQKAKEYGISGVGVYNSNHNGTEANWAMMALKHDMIGYAATTGSVNILAPWGGDMTECSATTRSPLQFRPAIDGILISSLTWRAALSPGAGSYWP